MLRLNKLTDYAIVILTQMAGNPDCRSNAGSLAKAIGLSEATVAKTLKDLARSGLVASTRGAMGGYSLCHKPQEITVRAIVEAIDGPIAIADCIDGQAAHCCASERCPVKGNWNKVNAAIIAALDGVTLIDMMPQKQIYTIVEPAEKLGMTA